MRKPTTVLALLSAALLLSLSAATAANIVEKAEKGGCSIRYCKNLSVSGPNPNYSPICMRTGARLRGLSLSGRAEMQQIDGPGQNIWKGKPHRWHARYRLQDGCALLHAEAPSLIHVGEAAAFISENTTVVMHSDKLATRFINLADHHRNSMKVIIGNHYVNLDPGFEVVIVHAPDADPKVIAIQEHIGYREMKQLVVDEMIVFSFRVNSADMLKECKIYRQLSDSPLDEDYRLREELMKTVAALDAIFIKRKGPYIVNEPYLYGTDDKQLQAARKGRKTQ